MRTRFTLLCTLLPLSLAACDGNVKDSLGLAREAPDEFTVVSRPPLSLPPDFSLRPPEPGAPPLASAADQQARSLITGQDAAQSASAKAPTASDSFLKRLGADKADPAIRNKLTGDAATPADTSSAKTLMDKLSTSKKEEPMVDPEKETERLKQNRDAGKPVNAGDVPEIKPKSESLIDQIF